MKVLSTLTALFFLFFGPMLWAQNAEILSMKMQEKKLETAIQTGNIRSEAEAYVALADNYSDQNNFSKSEEYLLKAKPIYEKLNDNKNLSEVIRKLAQAQEKQRKLKRATENYKKASKIEYSKASQTLNKNDYSRLQNASPEAKVRAVQQNIAVNSANKNTDELSQDYENLADIQVQQGKIPQAAENLNAAYEISKKEEPKRALEINQQMTDLYVKNEDFSKAIEAKKEILKEDFVEKNSEEKTKQIQELANIYLQTNDKEEAIKLYKKAYDIAISKNHTMEARKSLLKLDSLYHVDGNSQNSISLYQNFLSNLPTLLDNDQSLVDSKIIQETEARIQQLEKEKTLNAQLIKRKNLFNYLLIGGLISALGFIAFALFTQKKLRTQNKKIELQSLRREMNPHFIFNSLNSVNQFIAENNELEANQYLTKFSKLMRGVMENSKEDFIPFQEEFDLLNSYLALEKSRFHDKFDYEIKVSENIDPTLPIPGMLIQPFLENAIWHGLRYRDDKGFLKLNFDLKENKFLVQIEDNGIGIEKSNAQKTIHQKQRNGRGMKNTLERISLLNSIYHKNISVDIEDSKNGVTVKIIINH